MSESVPNLAAWERTLLDFLLADAKKALKSGPKERFIVVLSPKACTACRKVADTTQCGIGAITIHGIDAVIDPDLPHEYVIQDLKRIACKIEHPPEMKR